MHEHDSGGWHAVSLCYGTELSNCSHFKITLLVPKSLVLVVVNMGRRKILPFYCVCYSLTNSRALQYAMMYLEVVPLLGHSVNSYFVFSLCQSQCRYQGNNDERHTSTPGIYSPGCERDRGKIIRLMIISLQWFCMSSKQNIGYYIGYRILYRI